MKNIQMKRTLKILGGKTKKNISYHPKKKSWQWRKREKSSWTWQTENRRREGKAVNVFSM
jgi:hypothetical protein